MSAIDIEAIEARLGRRLTKAEVARLRDLANLSEQRLEDFRAAMARFNASRGFDSALATLRQAQPAAVSLTWGRA